MERARLTDIIMSDKTNLQMYRHTPKRYLLAESGKLKLFTYPWIGEIDVSQLQNDDIPVAIDACAHRQRNAKCEIKHLRTGEFTFKGRKMNLKIFGVIRHNQLLVVTDNSPEQLKDIAPKMPIRVAGLREAIKRFHTVIRC